MSRRPGTVSTDDVDLLLRAAVVLLGTDDPAEVLPFLVCATATVLAGCNRDPERALAAARQYGPVLAEAVAQVQAMQLGDAKPEGNA